MKSDRVAVASIFFPGLGKIWIAASAAGVKRVHLGGDRREFLHLLRKDACRPVREGWAQEATRQLREYLAGRRRRFFLKLAPPPLSAFQRRVYRALERVPFATSITYGRLAEAAGFPGAARAVGRAMASNPLPLIWPCHRVRAVSGLGGFGAGLAVKRTLIRLEARAARTPPSK